MDNQNQEILFGAIADLQYCDADPEINRYFRNAPKKLSKAIREFNKHNLAFTVNLGDTIDRNWESFDVILPHFERCDSKVYHVLGNHDYEVKDEFKAEVHTRIGTSKYFDFAIDNWQFLILDGNEMSTYANPKGSENYLIAENFLAENKVNSNFWNGGIGKEQLNWLKEKLEYASKSNRTVIIFCHFPIFPAHKHNLLNDWEVLQLIGDYNCVKAWICGHNHDGNYGRYAHIHFINLKGIVDTENETAFSVFRLSPEKIEILGFGSEISAKLIL
ncbi:MAG: hypothetical protein MI975_13885 [Cytophagales bacterium]|nr:hypothetical protein [Cytophagales bacterium]